METEQRWEQSTLGNKTPRGKKNTTHTTAHHIKREDSKSGRERETEGEREKKRDSDGKREKY